MSNEEDNSMPRTNASDVVAMVARSGLGAVPLVGAALAEIVTVLIPNQRSARVEAYIKALAERLDGVVARADALDLADPWKIDLFEEGAFQSARAVSDQRRDYIVSVVARGLSGEQIAVADAKSILWILRELDERQLVILVGYLPQNGWNSEYRKLHADVFETSMPLTMGTPQEEVSKRTYYNHAVDGLVTLKLLSEIFRVDDLKMAKLDHNGKPEVSRRVLSRLGAEVLFYLGFEVKREHHY